MHQHVAGVAEDAHVLAEHVNGELRVQDRRAAKIRDGAGADPLVDRLHLVAVAPRDAVEHAHLPCVVPGSGDRAGRHGRLEGGKVAGQAIRDLVTVNGVRVTVEDGTWGLVRASSNKPELVVVVESPVSEARMREMFKAVDGVLRTHPEVGAYNQTI